MESIDNSELKEQLKCYADTPRGEKNKFFCFCIKLMELDDTIIRFITQGFKIRAALYQITNTSTGEIKENTKIDLSKYNDYFSSFPTYPLKKLQIYIKVKIN